MIEADYIVRSPFSLILIWMLLTVFQDPVSRILMNSYRDMKKVVSVGEHYYHEKTEKTQVCWERNIIILDTKQSNSPLLFEVFLSYQSRLCSKVKTFLA